MGSASWMNVSIGRIMAPAHHRRRPIIGAGTLKTSGIKIARRELARNLQRASLIPH